MVGINGIGIFLGANDIRTETIVRHIDHAVMPIGADHVGIGLDYVFDQKELDNFLAKMSASFRAELGFAAGMKMVEPERMPAIVERLMVLGYSDATIGKILGDNHLRVAEQGWR